MQMDVSLARDASGNPFPLPDNAAFWRVRRHTGGRPSVVVGPNGEPLFIAITGDVDALLDAGCAPGSYRLEAVDVQRRPVGAPIAFVEISEPQPQPIASSDLLRASIEALTRTTEAMQRTQLERERATAARERELMNAQIEAQRALVESQKSQMQLVVSLFERVAPAGDPVAVIKQQMSLQRLLEKQRNAGGGESTEIPAAASSAEAPPWWMQAATQYGPLVGLWASGKMTPQELLAALATQGVGMPMTMPMQPQPPPQATDAPATTVPTSASSVEPSPKEKIEMIFERLTADERVVVKQRLDAMPDDAYERTMRYVAGLPTDDAASWVKSLFVPSSSNGHPKA
jgi:hypothetical protein